MRQRPDPAGAAYSRTKPSILFTGRVAVLAPEMIDIIQPDMLVIDIDESVFLQP